MTNQTLSAPDRSAYRYRFGTAEFNEARFELRVAGLVVETERRALEVLAYLLRHAGEVVTKEELLREVWAGRITVEKVLPNAINKLRRALGEANAELIATAARIGYRLDGTVQRTAVGKVLNSNFEFKQGGAVPSRGNFLLQKQLSKRPGGEVWLAQHRTTHEQRVYKFADSGATLRSLKREATLARVLQESLSEQSEMNCRFLQIIDWNFEHAPYFLECEYGGQNLAQWAETALAAMDADERVALFISIAEAVALAHALGVLHKDLKPSNIVVLPRTSSTNAASSAAHWQVRLTDFGSGRLLDPDRLGLLGISQLGLTVTQSISADDASGTPLYVAPELFSGVTPNVQSDVYALGIILFQLLSGQLHQPMATGWEQHIPDPILRADLQAATEGDPTRRMASVQELITRLRHRSERAEQARLAAQAQESAQRAQQELALARARRPYFWAFVAALVVSLVALLFLQQKAEKSRVQAQAALAQATALNRFINEDLIGRANPLLLAKGQSTQIKDLLLAARSRIADRYQDQPAIQAELRANLAQLFLTTDLVAEAEQEARFALDLYQQAATDGEAVLAVRSALARALTRQSKFDEARKQLEILDQAVAKLPPLQADWATAAAWAAYYTARSQYAKSVPKLKAGIAAAAALDGANTAPGDWLRLDLITALNATNATTEALAVGEQLLADAKKRGNAGLLAALTQVAMARGYSYNSDYDRAEALLKAAQPVVAAELGPNHARSLTIVTELMAVAFRRYDYPAALVYAEQAHHAIRALRGEDHLSTWVTLGNWGRPYFEMGNAAEAKAKFEPAYRNLVRLAGADSPSAQDVAYQLALCNIELNELNTAEELLSGLDAETLEGYRGHGAWKEMLSAALGLIAQKRGDRAGALALLAPFEALMHPEDPKDPGDRLYHLVKAAWKGEK